MNGALITSHTFNRIDHTVKKTQCSNHNKKCLRKTDMIMYMCLKIDKIPNKTHSLIL